MKNNIKYRINAVIITAITIVAVILLNAVISTVSSKLPMKIDLTRDKVYEFSDYTKEVISNLDKEISVYALYPSNTTGNEYITYAEEYLKKYEALSKNFKVIFVDPYNNPGFTKKYEEQGETISSGSVILECGENVEIVAMEDMYSSNQYTGETSIDMEKKITSAVVNVTGNGEQVKVYFTEGHNEHQPIQLSKTLEGSGYVCEFVNIAMKDIPEDASLLILMSPEKDFTPEERDSLDKYLDDGGKVIVVSEPGKPVLPRLDGYISEWGIEISGDYVIEGDSNHAFQFQNGLTIPSPVMNEHKINESLIRQKLIYMAPTVSSLKVREKNIRNTSITKLLTTTKKSYGKTNLSAEVLDKEEGDNDGPLTVAALSEMNDGSNGKLMVLGSVQAVELAGIMTESSYANSDFILNTVA